MKLSLSRRLDFLPAEPAGQAAFFEQDTSDVNLEVFHAMVA
ncbi:hypothetical protein [Polaromonas sp. CG9_12]|nr:hypothetical protein [Polaromonas sp. CG9_12]CDS55406.1 hypothetical protein [Polaromonas sp. CG9_12]